MSGEERGGIKAHRDMPQLAEKGIENGRAFCQVFRKKTLKKSRDREGRYRWMSTEVLFKEVFFAPVP